MNDGVLLSLDFVDARAFSLSLSALSALSLSLFSVDLQTTSSSPLRFKEEEDKVGFLFGNDDDDDDESVDDDEVDQRRERRFRKAEEEYLE